MTFNRILLAKVGLDGHDRGIKVVSRGLRDAGFHVIYGGIWQSPEAVAQAALDEDADWLGISLLNGAHMTLVPRVLEAVRQTGNTRTRCMLGGIIPEDDIDELHAMGIDAVFGPGTSIESIAEFLRQDADQPDDDIRSLVDLSSQGQRRSLTRLLTLIADGSVKDNAFSEASNKRIRTIAITGSAGVGKSSTIAQLLQLLQARRLKTGVFACDPQSPVTGGAILGDRIRMSDSKSGQSDVLIRSLAVPSGQQGIAAHLDQMIMALDVGGFDLALIESVGVGQGDVAVKDVADRVIVLLQPESGDDVQWEKAGLLEVADLIVIQKSDLPGADRLEAELKEHFNLPGFTQIPILKISAASGDGIDALCDWIMSPGDPKE